MERLPKPTPAWALSFPQPRSHPPNISTDGLHELVTTKGPAVDFIIVDVRRTDVDVRTIQDPWCYCLIYCRLPTTIGRDPWCHQLARANILSFAPDADHSSRKDPDRSFPLFFITRESHALRWMASRCTVARFKVQGLHFGRWNKGMACTVRGGRANGSGDAARGGRGHWNRRWEVRIF